MSYLKQLRCPQCGQTYSADIPIHRGCPLCQTPDRSVNLVCDYDWDAIRQAVTRESFGNANPGLWRYEALLPINAANAVSLGEGGTALTPLPRLGRDWGVPNLYVKNETRNPTWSHKDRLAAMAVAAGKQAGARVITAASTGNHGAAAAAYAARAGLESVIFTVASVPDTMKVLMQVYGARLVATPTLEDRYRLMLAGIERHGWYPVSNGVTPPLGSNPFGVEGYKTMAYEICEQLGWRTPDWLVVPVAYGDCLSGLWRGFVDFHRLGFIDRLPRIIAAEVFGPLARALSDADAPYGPMPVQPTAAFSIGTPFTTYQAVAAVRQSGGVAASAAEAELVSTQLRLGAQEGLYAEASSIAGLAVVRQLAEGGVVRPGETVVSILTSSGLKDPAMTNRHLPPVSLAEDNAERGGESGSK